MAGAKLITRSDDGYYAPRDEPHALNAESVCGHTETFPHGGHLPLITRSDDGYFAFARRRSRNPSSCGDTCSPRCFIPLSVS